MFSAARIETSRTQNDLPLSLKEKGGSVTVQNWYSGNDYRLQEISFADGATWKASEGQLIEAYFQEQAELAAQSAAMQSAAMSASMIETSNEEALDPDMMAAAFLLMEESADFSDFETQLFEEEDASSDLTTAELNTTSDFEEKQSVVDFAWHHCKWNRILQWFARQMKRTALWETAFLLLQTLPKIQA